MNEFVSKKIAEIAKEKGFNEDTLYVLTNIWNYQKYPEVEDLFYKKEIHKTGQTFIDRIDKEDIENPDNLKEIIIKLPTYQQLIKWIFNWVYNYTPPNDEERLLYTTEWLEFWYNTLIPELTNIKIQDCTTCKHYISKNEVLESCANYDIFVPKHKGWKCDKYIDKIQTNEFVLEGFVGMLLNWISENTNYHLYIDCGAKGFYYWTINRYKERDWIGGSDNKSFKTIQQARHEGILQCFKLLKENYENI